MTKFIIPEPLLADISKVLEDTGNTSILTATQNLDIYEKIPADVYSEEFLVLFNDVLNKFVDEYDDMAQMNVLSKARDLLQAIDEQ